MDISNFMSWFLNMFLGIIKFIYDTLDSITFSGVSLLQYFITVLVLIPILTILFTLVTSEKIWDSQSEVSKKKKESDKK
ncbi:MAG: hypothetical protein K2H20_03430 [Bacilli bacterium]|nr:hypothetical protein [Bacilli bacterium]